MSRTDVGATIMLLVTILRQKPFINPVCSQLRKVIRPKNQAKKYFVFLRLNPNGHVFLMITLTIRHDKGTVYNSKAWSRMGSNEKGENSFVSGVPPVWEFFWISPGRKRENIFLVSMKYMHVYKMNVVTWPPLTKMNRVSRNYGTQEREQNILRIRGLRARRGLILC